MTFLGVLARTIPSILFEYETSKVVQITSWKIGFIYRLIQFGIILYIAIWVMYHEKGYQVFDYPVAGVTAKLKGIGFANLTNSGAQVWDVADFVVPPQQNSAFFVSTNMVITANQTLGRCPESTDVNGANCTEDSDCEEHSLIHTGSGIMTGKCVISDKTNSYKVCEIYGWCPTENDVMPIPGQPLLSSAPNFTVLLKNSIEFPKFNVKRRNILSWMDKKFLNSCRYDPKHPKNKFCPIFQLKDLIKFSNAKNQNIWTHGGLLSIHIEWNCNLDINYEKCIPEYTFRRLDDFDFDVGKGWNFRYSHHFMENGVEKRTLIKAYGIQCFITVSGRGGKFNPFAFSMNLGSGLALLGIASVLCDIVVLNLVRKREIYKKARTDQFRKDVYSISNNDKQPLDSGVIYSNPNMDSPAICSERCHEMMNKPCPDTSEFMLRPMSHNKLNNYNTKNRTSRSSDCILNNNDYFDYSKEGDWNEFLKISKSTDLAWVDEASLSSYSE